MREELHGTAIALTVLLSTTVASVARPVLDWPVEKLWKEADIVAIGEATSSVDSGEVVTNSDWRAEFVVVNTTFENKVVLKGTLRKDRLVVFHYRAGKGVPEVNGPCFVAFRTGEETEMETKFGRVSIAGVRAQYLLFLKKRTDGRYEPVSGPIDSTGSVRELMRPEQMNVLITGVFEPRVNRVQSSAPRLPNE